MNSPTTDHWQADPRHTQIAILLCLCVAAGFTYQIDLKLTQLLVSVSSALLSQLCFSRFYKQQFDWRSPLITGLSLSLLLRMNDPLWAGVAATLAISTKYLFRFQYRHIFNPANAAIVILLLLGGDIWVSPGQWGNSGVLVLLLVVLGISVLLQTRQWDIAFVFMLAYGLLLGLRATYLGDNYHIPLNQLHSGTLLIFAFFMLSDPKTIPAQWQGRAVFAIAVVLIAFVLRFYWYINEAIFYALFIACLAKPVLAYIVSIRVPR